MIGVPHAPYVMRPWLSSRSIANFSIPPRALTAFSPRTAFSAQRHAIRGAVWQFGHQNDCRRWWGGDFRSGNRAFLGQADDFPVKKACVLCWNSIFILCKSAISDWNSISRHSESIISKWNSTFTWIKCHISENFYIFVPWEGLREVARLSFNR